MKMILKFAGFLRTTPTIKEEEAMPPHCGIDYGVIKSLLIPMFLSKQLIL